jgi:phosphopantothenoylcysteine synthetase/decarboxylase
LIPDTPDVNFKPELILEQKNYPRVLITGGSTTEPLDDERFMPSMRSGRSAHALALKLTDMNCRVTFILSTYSAEREGVQNLKLYGTCNEFLRTLQECLQDHEFDFLIHTASVGSEHIVETPLMPEGMKGLKVVRTELPGLVELAKHWSRNPRIRVLNLESGS